MSVPIDWTNVDWLYVVVLAVFVLIASFAGNLLSLYHRGFAALLSAVIFAVIFVFWTYYPYHVPFLPKTLTLEKAAVTAPAPPPAPPAPVKPSNPITDITPPKAQ
jgi:uncharacterized membrane protein YfcA